MADLTLPGIIGALGVGDYAPTKNANYDPNDPNSNPYNNPSFWTKILHPEVAQQEAAYNNATYNAALENRIKNTIAGQNFQQGLSGFGKDVTQLSPQEASILMGGNNTMQNLYDANVKAAQQRASIPTLNAQGLSTELQKGIRSNQADLTNGIPEAQSAARGAEAGYQTNLYPSLGRILPSNENLTIARNLSNTRLTPFEESQRRTGATADTLQNQRVIGAMAPLDSLYNTRLNTDLNNAAVQQRLSQVGRDMTPEQEQALQSRLNADLSNSKVASGMSQQELDDLALRQKMMHNQQMLGTASSYYGGMKPIGGWSVGDTGVNYGVNPGAVSPEMMRIQNLMNGGLNVGNQGVGSIPKTIIDSNGKPVATPPSSVYSNKEIDPLTNKPITAQPTIAPVPNNTTAQTNIGAQTNTIKPIGALPTTANLGFNPSTWTKSDVKPQTQSQEDQIKQRQLELKIDALNNKIQNPDEMSKHYGTKAFERERDALMKELENLKSKGQ